MTGIINFLQFLYTNWTSILVCIGFTIGIIKKTKDYSDKSDEEKIKIAKKQIKQIILKMISQAEDDYAYMTSSGSIKRSQVIKEVFEKYPILSKAVNQEEIINFIDACIDNSLDKLKEIIDKQDNECRK